MELGGVLMGINDRGRAIFEPDGNVGVVFETVGHADVTRFLAIVLDEEMGDKRRGFGNVEGVGRGRRPVRRKS